MKRRISSICFLCAISICIGFVGVTAHAATVYINEYLRYTVEETSVTIVGYNGTENEVMIPTQIAGNPVNTIAKGAFADCSTVKKVYLPDTIMSIEEGAFAAGQEVVYKSNPGGVLSSGENTEVSKPSGSAESNTPNTSSDNSDAGVVDEGEAIIETDDGQENIEEDVTEGKQEHATSEHEKYEKSKRKIAIAIVILIGAVTATGYFLIRRRRRR